MQGLCMQGVLLWGGAAAKAAAAATASMYVASCNKGEGAAAESCAAALPLLTCSCVPPPARALANTSSACRRCLQATMAVLLVDVRRFQQLGEGAVWGSVGPTCPPGRTWCRMQLGRGG